MDTLPGLWDRRISPGFILLHGWAIPIFRDRHPQHLISFHMLTKRPKPVCLPAEKCKPVCSLAPCRTACQQGASTCVVNTGKRLRVCILLLSMTDGGKKRGRKVRQDGDGVTGRSAGATHAYMQTRRWCGRRPAFGNEITLTLRSMVLRCDEYEGPSSPVTVSNGSGLFSITAPYFGPRRKLTFP